MAGGRGVGPSSHAKALRAICPSMPSKMILGKMMHWKKPALGDNVSFGLKES
jgi:hypothetical protein